jgi:hypothetical protein
MRYRQRVIWRPGVGTTPYPMTVPADWCNETARRKGEHHSAPSIIGMAGCGKDEYSVGDCSGGTVRLPIRVLRHVILVVADVAQGGHNASGY